MAQMRGETVKLSSQKFSSILHLSAKGPMFGFMVFTNIVSTANGTLDNSYYIGRCFIHLHFENFASNAVAFSRGGY